METGSANRKRGKLGSILMGLLIAVAFFIMLFAVLQLAAWVVRTTFPEEELSGRFQPQTIVADPNLASPGTAVRMAAIVRKELLIGTPT